jgi:hypothetical protein
MNSEIRHAVERLFATCLDVTMAGKYHAHMDYAAHVGMVSVQVYPADTKYASGVERAPLVNADVYIDASWRQYNPAEFDADAVAKIGELVATLRGYLQERAA